MQFIIHSTGQILRHAILKLIFLIWRSHRISIFKKKKHKVRLYYYFHVISLESFIFVLHELIPYSAVYTLMLGKIGSRRRRGWQRMRWLGGITSSMHTNLGKFCKMVRGRTGKHGMLPPMGVANSQTWLGDWTNPLFITDVYSFTS